MATQAAEATAIEESGRKHVPARSSGSGTDSESGDDASVEEGHPVRRSEKSSADLRLAYSKLNKLLTIASQGMHHESILATILNNRNAEWNGVSHHDGVMQVPLEVLGLGGGDAAFSIRTKRAREADEGVARTGKVQSETQKALKQFQSADVKAAIRALLGDKLAAFNEAACTAVDTRNRKDAELKVDAAVARLNEKPTEARSKALKTAQARLEDITKKRKQPFAMPADGVPRGDAEKEVNRVLAQLQGNLWTFAKDKLRAEEDSPSTLATTMAAAKANPATLVQSQWFRDAFEAATGTKLPSEAPPV